MIDKAEALGLLNMGLSYAEISEKLNCSVSWCYSNLKSIGNTLPRKKNLDYNVDWTTMFYTDNESPTGLRWLKPTYHSKCKVGDVAGSNLVATGGSPYWVVRIDGKTYMVSRIIWVMLHGAFDLTLVVDHLDGNPTNNNSSNLALKTVRSNLQNVVTKSGTGLPKGVSYRSVDGRNYYRAAWTECSGKRKERLFACSKLGVEEAKQMAISLREEQVSRLNNEGMGYTERHCKNNESINSEHKYLKEKLVKLSINAEFSDILFQLRRDTGQSINTLIYKAIEDMNNNYKQERAHDGPTKQPDDPDKRV